MAKLPNMEKSIRRMVSEAVRLKAAADRGGSVRQKQVAADILSAMQRVRPLFDPAFAHSPQAPTPISPADNTAANSGE